MKGLTPKQVEITRYIEKFIKEHDYAPSYRELMDHFGFSSTSSVHKHLESLKKKGVISKEYQQNRSIALITHSIVENIVPSSIEIPLVGLLSSLFPCLEMFVQPQPLQVAANLVKKPGRTYGIKVEGDFLREEAIYDGDLLLIEVSEEIMPGETILAIINRGDAIVRRYYPEGEYIRLESLYADSTIVRQQNMKIHGTVIHLLRSYRD